MSSGFAACLPDASYGGAMSGIGFIGTGTMGTGMIQNLVKGGHRPLIWNRTARKAEAISGVEIASTAADLAEESEVVFL